MEQRIRYQRAIEEVYWRHRVWPDVSRQPKPALDEAMPRAVIAAKVQTYLNKSRALEVDWHWPMTDDFLHGEMARMTGHTRNPAMLRELWTALGNDPYVIAECLARASLVNNVLGVTQALKDPLPAGFSIATSGAAPAARYGHTAVWTGSEMIVWGGSDRTGAFNTGARYDPATDSWTPISTIDAPSARDVHSAVWTGREMIVWGGVTVPSTVGTGGRYDPATDTWQAVSTVNAPTSRRDHTAVWTGAEMIVWGGVDPTGTDYTYQTGGRYDPMADSWTATSVDGAPSQRAMHTTVWTRKEMIVWGGMDLWTYALSEDAGRYDPMTDTWTATSAVNAPPPRVWHTTVWTGSTMIVWGGGLSAGGRYDPGTDIWTSTTVEGAPPAACFQTAVWDGSEMIIWGGFNFSSTVSNSGGRYDPAIDAWTPVDQQQSPSARYLHSAVWTGSEMIIWGGHDGTGARNDGGRYDPSTDSWSPTAVGQD
jgi:N-acetylneuraminic acid mutarotase